MDSIPELLRIHLEGFLEQVLIDASDIKSLTIQLGRHPRAIRTVLLRCREGFPAVVLNSPILPPAQPFPTLYWLTCPFLNKQIAMLENEGWITRFQNMMGKDVPFEAAFARAQREYMDTRKQLLAEVQTLANSAVKTVTKLGIGGVADLSKVKCLHAHYAHFLATGRNPVGVRVHRLIGRDDCPQRCA